MTNSSSSLQFKGAQDLPSNPEMTWTLMTRADVLAHCIKGCDEVKIRDDGIYEARFSFGFGPLKKTICAELSILAVSPPESYVLDVGLQTRRLGQAGGKADVRLIEVGSGCALHYVADISVSGWFYSFAEHFLRAAAGRALDTFFSRFCEFADAEAPVASD